MLILVLDLRKNVDLEEFYKILHPRPAYIIGSGKYGVEANLMAASWVTPIAEEPPRTLISIDKRSYTWRLIKKYKVFTVNIVGVEYVNKLYWLGRVSGLKVDKIVESGFTVRPGVKVDAPILEEAIAIVECRVSKDVDAGDTTLFIGDVVYCEADSDKYSRFGWDLRRAIIPLHLWGNVFAYTCRVSKV